MNADEAIEKLKTLQELPEITTWPDDVKALKMAILALQALKSIDTITSAWRSVL